MTSLTSLARSRPVERILNPAGVVAQIDAMEYTASLAVLSAGLLALVGLAAAVRSSDQLPTTAMFVAACAALLAGSLLVRGRLAAIGAVVAIATITVFSKATLELTPTVVWLFALVVPVVGLVHGVRLGAVAGAISAPALHWIETGVAIDLLDPQTPFGILILVALGATPAYLLTLARRRGDALNVQLARAESLVVETERARSAEGAARHQAIFMLARAAEARDGTTGIHIEHVRDLAAQLARVTGIAEQQVQEVAWSAMLHDVGKLRVPDRVLLKPGSLTEDEWALIRQHPIWGEQLLMGDEGFELARKIARWHHENWDGSGYPDGLRAEAIPLAARIVRVVDVFDALRSERPYKPAWTIERSLEELRLMRGMALDTALVDAFVDLQTLT